MIRIAIVALAYMVVISCTKAQNSENQSQVNTQTEFSQDTIPLNVPTDIRKEIERLHSPVRTERAAAIVKLGKFGEKATPAIPILIKMLDDRTYIKITTVETSAGTSFEYRTFMGNLAEETLARIGEAACEPLIAALKDSLAGIRSSAASVLGTIGDPRAIQPLLASLKDNSVSVRGSAAWALSKIGDPRAIQPLIQALKNEPRSTYIADARGDISNALEKMTGENFSEYEEWQKWWEQNKQDFIKNR